MDPISFHDTLIARRPWQLSIFFFLSLGALAQCDQQTWTYYMQAPGVDVLQRMAYHPNGDLYIAGSSSLSGGQDILVARFTSDTVLVWAKTYDLSGSDGGESLDLHVGPSGALYVAGAMSLGSNQQDAALMKLDEDGDVLWTRRILPMGGLAYARAVIEAPDGDVFIAGSTNSIGAGNVDAFAARLSSSGTLVWLRSYGGTGQDHFTHIERLADDTYVLGSQTSSFGSSTRKGYLLRIDASGAVLGADQFGGLVYDDFISSHRNADGTFLRIGFTESHGPGVRDVLAVLTDSLGGVIWSRAYGTPDGSEWGLGAISDGGAGWFVTAFSSPSREVHLLHLRPDGSLLRVSRVDGLYVHDSSSWTRVIYPAADGHYWLAGSASITGVNADMAIVKLDACGMNYCDMTEIDWDEAVFNIAVQSITVPITATSTNVTSMNITGVDVTTAFAASSMIVQCVGSSVRDMHHAMIDRINVFPNPVSSGEPFRLERTAFAQDAPLEVILSELTGRTVLRVRLTSDGYVDTASLQAGTYLIRLVKDQEVIAMGKITVL